MSRISKDLASTISKKLTIKLFKKIEETKNELIEYTTKITVKRVNKDVLEFYSKYPKNCYTTTTIHVYGNGFNGELYDIKCTPTDIEGIHYRGKCIQDLNKEESEKLLKLTKSYKKLIDDHKKLKESIYNALLQLMTYKRIIEQFPEAAPYLERKDAYAIAIPVEDIRKQLNELK